MVYFIGAGPGDPELITVKGRNIIEKADVIIYAGSLVNNELLKFAKENSEIHDSSKMTLEEVIEVMENTVQYGKIVARVHTGDPSIYGAIREQMDQLKKRSIKYEIIPGVSSFVAAAAALEKEYTLPGVTQTVILTRMEGRTSVPGKESIEMLAAHGTTMVIFLSIGMIDELVEKLKTGYLEDTPVAVVYKASWPDQRILRGTLKNISGLVKEAGIDKTALVTVGDFLGDDYELSKLYDKSFSHEFRGAVK
ncbi:precorrin-4 C(11)-methyltransferase [Pseudobacteroides cellulosolvens]|uniref:Precorrin-4 C11-methyltransferase n=1 Tax=Pseudobacteroides cellulosolvens ATCC 35603 = DSM 2933 TaxID=398512 RepID=A0A0L6JQP2_9FIRM|nr:precorrin-4 C(11)-methyltransferase [Pseudobacteroides cellulosolvens]KNY28010.1 precorrin-4 C11-methyltransferase [Pseudobacteroides cellulosolvens ATCC 35603 = DSM 2933]